MKKSKLFARVFWATIFLWIFFLGTSAYVGYHNHPNFIWYNVGIMFATILFLALMLGFKRKEFKTELAFAAKKFSEELNTTSRR